MHCMGSCEIALRYFFSRARTSVSMSMYFQNSRSTGWRW
jgi:hypothetical protein